ncbi:MAG: DNA repair protein RecO [Proteobacteria bacterium]|nr:DNA repair protein RecO [Pseudomonadota bacterium]
METKRLPEIEGEFSTNAFVVSAQLFEENHKIVHLFTRDYGKMTCFARNAVRSKKRFGTQLDAGNTVKAFIEKSKTKLWTLKKIELLDMPLRARSQLSNVDVIFFLLSALKDLYPDEQVDVQAFDLVERTLKCIENPLSAKQLSWLKLSIARWFQGHLGYGDDVDFLFNHLNLSEEDFESWKSLMLELRFLDNEILKDFDKYSRISGESVRVFYNNWKEVTRLSWSYFEK